MGGGAASTRWGIPVPQSNIDHSALLAPPGANTPDEADRLDTFVRLTVAFAELGIRLHISTAVRWVKFGRSGVKLDARRIGGRWFCTRRAALRFIGADPTNTNGAQAPPTRPAFDNPKRQARTAAALDALGL